MQARPDLINAEAIIDRADSWDPNFPEELTVGFENYSVDWLTTHEIWVVVGNDWEAGFRVKLAITDDGELRYLSHERISAE
jgi:hypothetical protein